MADDLLFVYGTLMRRLRLPVSERLLAHADYLGEAWAQARLYDLGDYPGMVLSRHNEERVFGELFRLKAATRDWSALDHYEGCDEIDPEYQRQKINVYPENGQPRQAWAYCYRHKTDALPWLKNGRYRV